MKTVRYETHFPAFVHCLRISDQRGWLKRKFGSVAEHSAVKPGQQAVHPPTWRDFSRIMRRAGA
jgi:hypothetical protein